MYSIERSCNMLHGGVNPIEQLVTYPLRSNKATSSHLGSHNQDKISHLVFSGDVNPINNETRIGDEMVCLRSLVWNR